MFGQETVVYIVAHGRLKQEGLQFEASLGNHGNSPSQKKERKKETKNI